MKALSKLPITHKNRQKKDNLVSKRKKVSKKRKKIKTVYVIDLKGKILDTNESAFSLTNYPLDELLGSKIQDHLDPVTADLIQNVILVARPVELTFDNASITDVDGIEVNISVCIKPLCDEKEQAIGFVLHVNQSPVINREKDNKKDKSLCNQVHDHSLEAVLQVSIDLKVKLANKRGLELFSWKYHHPVLAEKLSVENQRKSILNMTFQNLDVFWYKSNEDIDIRRYMDEKQGEILEMMILKAMTGYQQSSFYTWFFKTDGTAFPAEVNVGPVMGKKNAWILIKQMELNS
jgi:PAS fold/PAS domain